MDVAAVIFDFYGTLAPGRSPASQADARREQAAALGVDAAGFDAALTDTYPERFRGEYGSVEQTLVLLARRLGVDPDSDAVAAAAQVRLAGERRFGEPRPEVVGLLGRLRARGLGIGLISDCSAELPVFFPELPIAALVDSAVFSAVTGQVKPDPPNYLLCCEQLGVVPQDCVYVGDGGSNELSGARAVGMRAVHLDIAGERAGVVYGRHIDWDGDVISSLIELLDLLDTFDLPDAHE